MCFDFYFPRGCIFVSKCLFNRFGTVEIENINQGKTTRSEVVVLRLGWVVLRILRCFKNLSDMF